MRYKILYARFYLLKNMPKVTVIIPTYNAIQYLPDAVGSALGQTFTDIEVVIINDGSSDHTEQWICQQTDPRLTLISQENQGKSAARNAGIIYTQGDYLAFLDADDCWEPTKLEKQVNCLDQNPQVGLVYTWTALADETGQSTGRIISSHAEGNVWKQLLQDNILACGSTPMVRRECFEVVGMFADNLPLAQDWDMWIRIAATYPFAVIKEPLARYRHHPTNTSKKLKEMQKYNTLVLERALATTSEDLSALKAKAYNSLNLYLGWIAIRNQDHQQALYFWKKACNYAPGLSLSRESMRLLLSIMLTRFLGLDTYTKLITFNKMLRRKIAQYNS